MQMIVSGIPIEIQKKKIKNMHLYVYPPDAKVQVSAPLEMTEQSIELFVRTKLGWIKKQREIILSQERQSERQYISGETLYFFGKQYFLQVEYSGKGNSMVLAGDAAILTVRKESTTAQRESFVNEWYRLNLKEEIGKLLPIWEERTGLHCSGWHTRYMTTRWGSCNTNSRKLLFNLQLAKKPIECLEYVILHELCHLAVRNHGAEFIALLDTYMPAWREIRKNLNDLKLDYLPSNKFEE